MDKVIYTAMSGAKQTMLAQAANNNNIANLSTPGFQADYAQFRSMPVYGAGHPSRVYAMTERSGTDFSHGPIITTGNALDVAINGDGWIAVQADDGTEAYTRAGNFQISSSGLLTTSGHPVLGESGPITIPPATTIQIAEDGTISILPLEEETNVFSVVERIKLVSPPLNQLQKGFDGLLHTDSGEELPADANISLVSGMLESSNVNVAEALVNMIDLSRQYEMQVRLMRDSQKNSDATRQLLHLA